MLEDKSLIQRRLNFRWILKMAWRDSRRNKSRLLLFISSIVLGIAALVAVYSFRDNLLKDIDSQAKELTGADLVIDSRRPVSEGMQRSLDTIGDHRAVERSFASMIYFQKNQGNRLVQIRALEGDYPFYGAIETYPEGAGRSFQNAQKALVDKTLMLQFGAKNGDSIKVGALTFVIEGTLNKAPGQTGISASIAPVVYIPLKYLEKTGLNKIGSRIQYKYYFKFNNDLAVEPTLKKIEPQLEKEGMDAETVESTKESTGRSFKDVNRFLALAGFVALLLGCIGVGSAINVYIAEKLPAIATLRCMGVKAMEAFLIYLVQIGFLGIIGALAGSALGSFIQYLLPAVLKDFIPVDISMQISWSSIGQGLALGLIIAILFALPALLAVRNISPLNALRISFEKQDAKLDFLKWLVYLMIVLFVLVFTYLQMGNWFEALIFTGGVLLAFALLAGVSRLLMWFIRRAIPTSIGYVWRQGFANLYRPNNQTLMLTVSIGLSTAFIATLYFVQGILINRVTLSSGENQPNMVLFDIQAGQREPVAELTRKFQLPIVNQVPIITVRIEEINGKSAEDLAEADSVAQAKSDQSSGDPSQRAFRGELRVTFQDTLTDAEKVVKGRWTGRVNPSDKKVFISLEEGYANRINVDLGDTILFNVQGMLIPTIVGSFREVNWSRMQTNFRVVFPTGVLEDAPQFHVLMTRVPSSNISARYQTAIVRNFPNVSVIDLELILSVLDELFSKIGFVIKFMAGFSMATGWIVLISSVLTSRNQRLKETVLLRTLGADRKQIMTITALEYFFLSILAVGTGLVLAVGSSWALAIYSFETNFSPQLVPIVILFLIICLIVVATGLLSNRKALNHPPLEILRKEA